MLTLSQLREIREAYVASLGGGPPNLTAICREHGADDTAEVKQVVRMCAKENWEAHRSIRAHKVATIVDEKEDKMVAKVADRMIQKRLSLLQSSVSEVETLLPNMLAELKARVELGFIDDKALVSAIKMLFDVRKHVVDTIQKEFHHQDDVKDKTLNRDYEALRDLGLLGKIADAIEGRVTAEHLVADNYDAVSVQDERHVRALAQLDDEVANEE